MSWTPSPVVRLWRSPGPRRVWIGPPSGSVDTRATIASHRGGPAAEPNQNRGIDPVALNGRPAGTERFLGHTVKAVSSLRGNADAVPIPKSCLAPPRRRSRTYEPSRRRRAVERGSHVRASNDVRRRRFFPFSCGGVLFCPAGSGRRLHPQSILGVRYFRVMTCVIRLSCMRSRPCAIVSEAL